jgi:bacterioferritin-associated ferredoxin
VVICSCQAVSDRTVREVIRHGATTVEDIADRCAAASRCGGCWPELERLIAEHARTYEIAAVA